MTDALSKLHELEVRLDAARVAEKAALAKLAKLNHADRFELAEFNLRLRAAKQASQAANAIRAELEEFLRRFYRKA